MEGLIAQRLTEGEKLCGALLELAESFNLGAVMGDLCRVAQATGDGAPGLVFEGIEGVRAAANLGAVFANTLDELFGDGAAPNLIEVVDLGEEFAAAGVELDGGRLR